MTRKLVMAVLGLVSAVGFAGSASAQAASCPQLISDTEARRQIPRGLLMAIAITESGVGGRPNPFAMNIAGRSYHARNFDDMASVISSNWSRGVRSIDVGCMQVNLMYHGQHFSRLTDLLNPATNVEYGASYLIRLAAARGSWREGVMDYHNKTSQARRRWYGCLVWNNYLRINRASSGFLQCGRAPGGSSTASNMRINTQPLVIPGYNDGTESRVALAQANFQNMHVSNGSIGGVPLVTRQPAGGAQSAPAARPRQIAQIDDVPSGSPLDPGAVPAQRSENPVRPAQAEIAGLPFDIQQPRQRVVGEIELAPAGSDIAEVTTSADSRSSAFQAVRPLDWSSRERSETVNQPEPPATSTVSGGFARTGPDGQ